MVNPNHQQIDAIDVDAPEEEIENKKEALTSVFQMRAQVTISLVAKFDKTCSSFKVCGGFVVGVFCGGMVVICVWG